MRPLQPKDLSLLFTAALAGTGILTLSYTDMSGMLSHDSMHYLRLAGNLVEGEGYRFSPSPGGEGPKFVATWPVGYPTLVAGLSLLTGWGVFLAGKLGYRVVEIPVHWYNSPSSRVSILGDPAGMFGDLFRIRYFDWTGRYDKGRQ
jgi:hypothetical protein